jgi:UDP-N-acetylmuramoylalanine--D-glutamate ligase
MEFRGVEHRIELVREMRGVKYYNDSIASSPSRTTAGLRSFNQKVILIAGGKDKGVPFDSLGTEIVEHVKKLVLTGLTADKIRAAVENCPQYRGEPEIFTCDEFKEAIEKASSLAERGDVVILSPACTSFDRFKNFEERGNTFKAIVNELK